MKLRNKKTGEIGYLTALGVIKDGKIKWYENIGDVNEEWEDYEEPKEEWYINCTGEVLENNKSYCNTVTPEKLQSIGNYFETREEAEKAVEKLKAWKRLKDKGFRFESYGMCGEYGNTITFSDYIEYNDETRADLDLLFGGEE